MPPLANPARKSGDDWTMRQWFGLVGTGDAPSSSLPMINKVDDRNGMDSWNILPKNLGPQDKSLVLLFLDLVSVFEDFERPDQLG